MKSRNIIIPDRHTGMFLAGIHFNKQPRRKRTGYCSQFARTMLIDAHYRVFSGSHALRGKPYL